MVSFHIVMKDLRHAERVSTGMQSALNARFFIRYGKAHGTDSFSTIWTEEERDIRDSVLSHEALQKRTRTYDIYFTSGWPFPYACVFFYPSVRRDFLEKDYHGPIGGRSLFGQRLS